MLVDNTLNPVWDEFFYFLVSDDFSSFKVELWDDDIGRDDKLGWCNILRRDEEDRGKLMGEDYYLEKGKGGTVEIYTQEIPLTGSLSALSNSKKTGIEKFIKSKARENQALLEVVIHGCKGLKSGFFDKSDPYCKFDFSEDPEGDKVAPQSLKTRTIDNNPSPVFEETFHFLIPSALKTFKIRIMDEDIGKDDSLGHVSVVCPKIGEQISHKRLAVSKKGECDISYSILPLKPLFE